MQRTLLPELLDDRIIDQTELNVNLADIARINRLSGTTAVLCRAVWKLAARPDTTQRPLSVLDVGTGAADFPPALFRYAARHGGTARVIATDLHSGVLCYARQTDQNLRLVQSDGTHLPLAARSVEVVTCAQVIHHLPPDQVAALLIECVRVSRCGVVLVDLERGTLAAVVIGWLTHLISRNRLTRYDGPLSARRAYRGAEIAQIALKVGLSLEVRRVFPFRWLGIVRVALH